MTDTYGKGKYGSATYSITPFVPVAPPLTPQDDDSWFDADRFVDPRDAPGEYFRMGAYDAQHGVKIAKSVDSLYQRNYDEGYAFGTSLDRIISQETM